MYVHEIWEEKRGERMKASVYLLTIGLLTGITAVGISEVSQEGECSYAMQRRIKAREKIGKAVPYLEQQLAKSQECASFYVDIPRGTLSCYEHRCLETENVQKMYCLEPHSDSEDCRELQRCAKQEKRLVHKYAVKDIHRVRSRDSNINVVLARKNRVGYSFLNQEAARQSKNYLENFVRCFRVAYPLR